VLEMMMMMMMPVESLLWGIVCIKNGYISVAEIWI
jgi:hypothetical protein